MVISISQSALFPAAGSAALIEAKSLPDGLGAWSGTGFTITGLTRAPDGSWWAANQGQADAKDKSYSPSLVHLSADLNSKIDEIPVIDTGTGNIQGLCYFDGRLYVGSTSDSRVKVFDANNGSLISTIMPSSATGVNGIAIDTKAQAVIIGHNSDSGGSTVEWRALSSGSLLKTITLQSTPDHLFFDPQVGTEGALWYTYGASGVGAIGRVVQLDIATGKNLQKFDLAAADAIEGIYVSDGKIWLANDAYYHDGQPALNRILQFQIGGSIASPVAVGLSNASGSLAENAVVGPGLKVADVTPSGGTSGNIFLSLSGQDAGSFAVRGTADSGYGLFYVGNMPNYEARTSYFVTVDARDSALSGSAAASQKFQLSISDVNEAPTALTLSSALQTIADRSDVSGGLKVADIIIADDGLGNNVIGLSGENASNFAIRDTSAGHSLYFVGDTPDYTLKNSYLVTVDLHDEDLGSATDLHQSFSLRVLPSSQGTAGPTERRDVLYGTSGQDILFGLGGDDLLWGLGGGDTLEGGTGNDVLEGGAGADLMNGGEGSDTIGYSSAAAAIKVDLLTPSKNSGDALGDRFISIENITGSPFSDSLNGDNGANILSGGDGGDTLSGQGGSDVLYGNAGNDILGGQGGNDRLDGGAGNDTLAGGTGGKDWFVFSAPNFGSDIITDYEAGIDEIDFRGSGITLSALTAIQNGANVLVSGGGGSVTVLNMTVAKLIIRADTGPVGLALGISLSAASIAENSQANSVVGDLSTATTGGNNSFTYALLDSAGGRFAIQGATLVATGISLDFEAAASHPIQVQVIDGAGNSRVDTFAIQITDVNEKPSSLWLTSDLVSLIENSPVGTGIKVADIGIADDALGANALSLTGIDAASFQIRTASGASSLYYVGSSPDFETKASYAVTVQVDDASVGSTPDATASYLLAIGDAFEGPGGSTGPTESDDRGTAALYGTSDADLLFGLGGNDELFGLGGNDTLDGGTGNDVLEGGLGTDVLNGGAGTDAASYRTATTAVKVDLLTPLKNSGDASGDSYIGIEDVIGSDFNDSLSGNQSANMLAGGAGHDTINGQGGADIMFGGAGNDTLGGQGGNDRLDGGAGDDTLSGGTGARDWFVISSANWGKDSITDFEDGVDLLDLRGTGLSFNQLSFAQQGSNLLVTAPDAASSIFISNLAVAQLTAADFLF